MSALLDPFIPRPDVLKRHEITIHAPAPLVLEIARNFNLQSLPTIRFIFWLRAKLLGAKTSAQSAWESKGLVAEMLGMGWGRFAEEPDRFFIAGAICQPWQADVIFAPVPAAEFAACAVPDRVKIAWTLEVETLGPALTRFATETRAVATDDKARVKFRHYWRTFGIGIRMIRWLLLPALRRQAEHRWQSGPTPPKLGSA